MKRVKKITEILPKKMTKKKAIILIVALVVVAVAALALGKGKNKAEDVMVNNDIVTRGDIEVMITGSASVEPYERFEIIPKVSGDITYCPYDVGDVVNKDDVLYQFDSSDSDLTFERQRISMKQSENSYKRALEESEKLKIVAKTDGVISGLNINVGDEVKSGSRIATVENTTILEVELPFTQLQVAGMSVGDTATVTSSKHMSAVSGTIMHISNTSYAGSDGTALYGVEIQFDNPGAFYAGMEVGGSVGNNISPGSGVIKNIGSGEIVSEINGVVSKIHYSNGDYVSAGTVVATLTSEDVEEKIEDSTLSYKSAQISMQQTEKGLEDYRITSPINGTVITKNAKAGDTIDKTNSAQTMMVVADISRLKFELAIDELDVEKVKEGQEVMISCDALPNETFVGVITNVSVEGVATNGVTTYSAKVEIPNPGNLRPSMNIDASIIVEAARDVLMVPTADITTIGNRSFVYVKDDGNVKKAEERGKKPEGMEFPEGMTPPEGMERPEGMTPPEGMERPEGMTPPEGMERPEGMKMPEGQGKSTDGAKPKMERKSMIPEAPEGYVTVEIVTGIANGDYTEVKRGLSEGQEVYSKTTGSSTSNNFMMGGGMSRNMGGGMSGMGGGMPRNMGGGMSGMGARPGGMR